MFTVSNLKKIKKTSLCVFIAMALAACTGNNIKDASNKDLNATVDQRTKEMLEEWAMKEPAVTYVQENGALVVEEPLSVPKKIREMPFSSELTTNLKISDIEGILKEFGVSVAIPDEKLRSQPLTIFDYKGTLGDFLDALSAAYKVSFNWNKGNILTIEESSQYLVRIPQDETIAEAVSKNIEVLGGKDVDVSLYAGSISYKANYRDHQRIVNFMENLSRNTALVSMQVALISVALDESNKSGIDWSQMGVQLGRAAVAEKLKSLADASKSNSSGNSSNSNTNTNTNTDTGTGVGEGSGAGNIDYNSLLASGTNMADFSSKSSITGTKSDLMVSKGDFAISAVVDYLKTYGNTSTLQSAIMKTLSGKDVLIDSSYEIPYIKSIGVSNLGNGNNSSNGSTGNTNNNNNNNNNNGSNNSNSSNGNSNSNLGLGTVEIDKIDVGLKLELLPFYQHSSELVTIGLDLELSSLLSFLEVSAGNQLGKISQPSTQKQLFTDMVKIRAGESVVIGGITYEQRVDQNNVPVFLQKAGVTHENSQFRTSALVIVIRPTVTVFRNLKQEKLIVR